MVKFLVCTSIAGCDGKSLNLNELALFNIQFAVAFLFCIIIIHSVSSKFSNEYCTCHLCSIDAVRHIYAVIY